MKNIHIGTLALIILIISASFWYQNQKTEETVSSVPSELLPSKGDKLGAMTVVSVEPFNTGQLTDSPEFMKLALNNMRLLLSGPIEVTGTYTHVLIDEYQFSEYCMSDFDAASLSRLPRPSLNMDEPYLCFRNRDLAKSSLGEESRVVTVKIDNYELISYPSEVTDSFDLIEVIQK